MISIITRIQVEGNDTVSFLNGTTPPYQYVQGMSQIMPQVPTYISYGYDSISITQDGSKTFQFSVYTVTDVGGNTFPALTFQDPSTTVQAKTIEIYRLLVTSVFKGCCECGNTEPECSIQYTAGNGVDAGTLLANSGSARINYFTANNQDFTGFWPIIQDGSWIFIFSKTDPTVFGVFQLSNYSDGGTYAQFDISLLSGTDAFPDGTTLCVDVTSVGGSLVQGWQDTLDINSTLDKDNTVDGGGFDFVFDNNSSFTINSANGSVETDILGASLNGGTNQVLVTPTYVNVITPGYAAAGTGWVLAKDASGHVEYVEAGTGTISSIGLNMPPAFTVSTPNPLTSNGEFTVDGAGTALEYINGLGELATVPVYTVANGLHTQETPADPNVFHLGGTLIEDTVITATNGTTEYVLGISGTTDQNSRRPLSVSNLGQAGAAVFSDYSSGFRANASVQMLTDNDLFQPILDLTMQGDLPAGGILADRTTMLRLKYDGTPAIGARTSIDYQFKSDAVSPANPYFIAGRLTTEIKNFTVDDMASDFELQLFSKGSRINTLVMEGKGQLELTNYATSQFWNGDDNIDNSLTYVLAVGSDGKVWKKQATGGGTVFSIDVNGGTGISVSPAGPITTSGTFTVTNEAPDQIVILNAGDNVTITGTYPEFTINASGGGGTGTVQQVNTAGLITGGPITTTGTITTSVNENRLVGRWDAAGTGIMQEVTIGTNLELTSAGVLNATGGGGTYTVNNGLSPDPLDANNFQLGGPLVQDTTITGATNAYDLNINELKTFNSTSKNGYNLTAINGGYLNLYNSNFYVEINDGGGNSTFIDQYANGLYIYASGEIDVQSTDSTTINSTKNNTVSAGISNYFNALTNNEISSDVNTEVYSKVSTDITSVSSTNIRSGSSYSNYVPEAGSAATVYAINDMSAGYFNVVTRDISGPDTNNVLFMKSTNGGSRHIGLTSYNAGLGAGLQIGIAASFSSSVPTILFQTPNVSNGSATVGQVLTLKSMSGTDKGRVEFEDATPASPLTTKGDIYTYDTADARLPVGLDTQVLIADSSTTTGLKWGSNTAPTPLGYYGQYFSYSSQSATTNNVGKAMIFETPDLSNGITVVTDGTDLTKITFANTGKYNLQFSTQFKNTDNAEQDVYIWLRKNGTTTAADVVGSTGLISIPKTHGGGAGTPGHNVVSWNFLLDVVAGDFYQLVWATSDVTKVTIAFIASTVDHPSTASTLFTVTQQAGIMAGTGVTAINGLTASAQEFFIEFGGTGESTPTIISGGSDHTIHIPYADGGRPGVITAAQYLSFTGKADLASPAFTGTPTAPTATAGTNDTQIATTAFVQSTISGGAAVPSYTMKANNTGASAVPTDQVFRYPGNQVYDHVANPISAGALGNFGSGFYYYNWNRVGNMVHYTFQFYPNTGFSYTSGNFVTWDKPSDMPNPIIPSGFSGNQQWLIRNFMTVCAQLNSTTQVTFHGGLRIKAAATPTFEFLFTSTGTITARVFEYSGTYFTS